MILSKTLFACLLMLGLSSLANANPKSWFSSSAFEVSNANCKVTRPKTANEIKKYYAGLSKSNLEESRQSVRGVQFVNERSHLIYAFKKLVTPINQTEKDLIPPADFRKQFNFGNCNKVLCASEIIFGSEVGPKMVYLMDHFELNTSAYAYSNSTFFNSGELTDLIESLEFLPNHLKIFKQNQKLSRYPRGKTKPGKDNRLLANASMEFFDSWTALSSQMRQYIAYHEYAHILAAAHLNSFDSSHIWRQMGNWGTNEAQFNNTLNKAPTDHYTVSTYATSNQWEDFAESLSSYRFNPALLKTTSIDKYNYIKFLVFDGQEFDNNQNCNPLLNVNQFQKIVNANKYPFTVLEKELIAKNCLAQFYRASFSNQPSAMFNQCVNYEASNIWYKKVQRYQAVAPHSIFDPHSGFSALRFPLIISEITNKHIAGASNWLAGLIMKHQSKLEFHQTSTQKICSQLSVLTQYSFKNVNSAPWENMTNKYNGNLLTPTNSGIKMICNDLFLNRNPKELLPYIGPSSSNSQNSFFKLAGVYFDKTKLTNALKTIIGKRFK